MSSVFVGAELVYNTPGIIRIFQDVYGGIWSASAVYGVQWRFVSAKPPKLFRFQLAEAFQVEGDFLPWNNENLVFDTDETSGFFIWGASLPSHSAEPWAVVLSDVPGTLKFRTSWG